VNYTGGSPACFVASIRFLYIIGEGLSISVQQIDNSFQIIEGTTLGPAEDVCGFHLENSSIVVIWVNGPISQEILFVDVPVLIPEIKDTYTVSFQENILTDPSTRFRVRSDASLLNYSEDNVGEDIEVIAGLYLQTGTAIVEANLDGSDELLFPRGFVNQFLNATRPLSTGRTIECPFVFYASGDFELSITSQNPNAKDWGARISDWSTDSFGLLYYGPPPPQTLDRSPQPTVIEEEEDLPETTFARQIDDTITPAAIVGAAISFFGFGALFVAYAMYSLKKCVFKEVLDAESLEANPISTA
jgi:hypothetical protein